MKNTSFLLRSYFCSIKTLVNKSDHASCISWRLVVVHLVLAPIFISLGSITTAMASHCWCR